MRLFQAALDTCLNSPFFASLSSHGLHFTVYAASSFGFLLVFSVYFLGVPEFQAEVRFFQHFSLDIPGPAIPDLCSRRGRYKA